MTGSSHPRRDTVAAANPPVWGPLSKINPQPGWNRGELRLRRRVRFTDVIQGGLKRI